MITLLGAGQGQNGSYVDSLITQFKSRVLSDDGTFEAESCLKTDLTELNNVNLLNEATLILTPNSYKEDTLFSISPITGEGDATFQRAGLATRVNPERLIEDSPYNLFIRSSNFELSPWIRLNGVFTENATTAPDGTLTAGLFTKTNNVGQTSLISRSSTVFYIGVITLSLYVKKNVGNLAGIRMISGTQFFYNFDTNGFVDVQGSLLDYGAIDAGNGWIRLYLTAEATGAINPYILNMFSAELGDSVYVWGAQLNKGYLKDYFPNYNYNLPRIDYTNGSCPSILVEPQRTNLALRSEEFSNSYWLKVNFTLTPNDNTSPDGMLAATLLTKTSVINTVASINRTNVFATTGIHTLSIFIKPKIGEIVLLRMDAAGNTANTLFNFTTKTFLNTGANIIASSYKEFPDGWFRLSLTANVLLTNWTVDVCNLFGNPTGDAMWIYGAQLEAGYYSTSYIPTYDTTVTRVNEGLSLSDLVTKNIVTSTEGTWFVHLVNNIPITKDNSTPTDRGLFIADTEAGTTNAITLRRLTNGTSRRVEIAKVIGGSTLGNIYQTSADEVKLVIRYNIGVAGSFDVFENGIKVITANTFTGNSPITYTGTRTSPSVSESPFINIKEMNMFNTQLTDQQCIDLSTL